jgi:murein tripeptide amidase MpaA
MSISKFPIPIWFQSGNQVVLSSPHSTWVAASKDLQQYGVENCSLFSKMADIRHFERIEVDLREARVKRQAENAMSTSWHQKYHNHTEIRAWFQGLASRYPNLVRFVPDIGQSHRHRPLFAVHITSNSQNRTRKQKMKVYIQCLLHAREWISGSVCQCLADFLTQQAATPVVRQLLRKLEYVFVPVANPDGYEVCMSMYVPRLPGTVTPRLFILIIIIM